MPGTRETALLFTLLLGLASSVTVNINATVGVAAAAIPVAETWASLTFWDYNAFQQPVPENTTAQYPFLKRMELFTATGGCYPADPSKGYNFSGLLTALESIIVGGFKPHIVTGNVPVALSASPFIGGFGFNSEPASDWAAYASYIAALAAAAVGHFGAPEVRSWWWGVLTEYNNADWYVGPPDAFFSLYDTTGCALQGVLGEGGVFFGTHMCTQCFYTPPGRPAAAPSPGKTWDPLLLLDHIASGNATCAGGTSRPPRLSFMANSFYETAPGEPGDLSWFAANMALMQGRAAALGLTDITWGIDEGRLLVGPASEGSLAIGTRALGASYQGSFDALLFKAMAARNFSWYSRWGVNTDGGGGLFTWPHPEAVDNVATNVARLTHRLVGDTLLASTNTSAGGAATSWRGRAGSGGGEQSPPPSIVDAAVTSYAGGRGLHALVFHHHPWLNATATVPAATAALSVCGLPPGGALAGQLWGPIGDSCGNFWPRWWADRARLNLTRYNSGWSQYGESISWEDGAEEAVWAQQLAPGYQPLANLSRCVAPWAGSADAAGCLRLPVLLPPHTVALLEAALVG